MLVVLLFGAPPVQACLWDSDTLLQERITSPKMASVVLDAPPKPDVGRLRDRIRTLRAAPREADPGWWNDLAGAHIRLGELDTAVSLLEPAVRRFPDDYGVHANLGTAYHLLKRYAEAEREIARDLELNPDAHFGLERYHLALLQYLMRDAEYRARHVYVDEWTVPFLTREAPRIGNPQKLLPLMVLNSFDPALARTLTRAKKSRKAAREEPLDERGSREEEVTLLHAMRDRPPSYRYRWDLARDPKFQEGVIYMASLNRAEPACWVMLGLASVQNHDLNLGSAAFRRAIELGSPQTTLLKDHVQAIRRHQRQAAPLGLMNGGLTLLLVVLVLFLLCRIVGRLRHWVRRAVQGKAAPTGPTS